MLFFDRLAVTTQPQLPLLCVGGGERKEARRSALTAGVSAETIEDYHPWVVGRPSSCVLDTKTVVFPPTCCCSLLRSQPPACVRAQADQDRLASEDSLPADCLAVYTAAAGVREG